MSIAISNPRFHTAITDRYDLGKKRNHRWPNLIFLTYPWAAPTPSYEPPWASKELPGLIAKVFDKRLETITKWAAPTPYYAPPWAPKELPGVIAKVVDRRLESIIKKRQFIFQGQSPAHTYIQMLHNQLTPPTPHNTSYKSYESYRPYRSYTLPRSVQRLTRQIQGIASRLPISTAISHPAHPGHPAARATAAGTHNSHTSYTSHTSHTSQLSHMSSVTHAVQTAPGDTVFPAQSNDYRSMRVSAPSTAATQLTFLPLSISSTTSPALSPALAPLAKSGPSTPLTLTHSASSESLATVKPTDRQTVDLHYSTPAQGPAGTVSGTPSGGVRLEEARGFNDSSAPPTPPAPGTALSTHSQHHQQHPSEMLKKSAVGTVDVGQLSDQVYRMLERKIRVEKERRGW